MDNKKVKLDDYLKKVINEKYENKWYNHYYYNHITKKFIARYTVVLN